MASKRRRARTGLFERALGGATWLAPLGAVVSFSVLGCSSNAKTDPKEKPNTEAQDAQPALAGAASGAASATGSPSSVNAPSGPTKTAPSPPDLSEPRPLDAAQAKALKTRARRFKQHLAAGRSHVRAGDYPAGIEALEAARKLRPHDAKVLGELGFAHYKAGQLPAATKWTQLALVHVEAPNTKGALLFNLGLIAKAEGRTRDARDYFEHSLAVRPNPIVGERLAEVQAQLAADGDANAAPVVVEVQAYCKQLGRDTSCIDDELTQFCGCVVAEHVVNPAPGDEPGAALLEAAVLNVGFHEGPNAHYESALVVRTRKAGWQRVASVFNEWSPEFIDEGAEAGSISQLRFEDLDPGGPLELVAHQHRLVEDLPPLDDQRASERTLTTHDGTHLCGGSPLRCVYWPTRLEIDLDTYADGDWADTSTLTTALSQAFEKGKLSLTPASGDTTQAPWAKLVGEHALADVFNSPLFVPTPLRP